MKKVIYLISILFALALMSASCEKDPIVPEPDGITAKMLEGNWGFVSLVYGGNTYDLITNPVCGAIELDSKGWKGLGFKNVDATTKTLTFTNKCSTAEFGFDFTLIKENSDYFLNIILDGKIEYEFQILNTELNVGDKLQITLIDAIPTNALVDGIWTLTR